MNLRSWAGPTALGVALASVAGGAVYLSRGSSPGVHAGSSGPPPKLRLASANGDRAAALGAPSSGGSQYTLEGTLSDDKPADGRVRHPRRGSAAAAAELASALGLDGTPTAIDGGWALRAPGGTILILHEWGSWSWQLDCMPDGPIQDAARTGCAVAGAPTTTPPPPGPSDDDAASAARPVLAALGFAGLPITSSPAGDSQTAAAVTPAAGWATSVFVSAAKKVVGGNGWLSGATEGDAYPLISAADAFELLKAQPRMAMDLCMQRKDGQPGCEEPAPTVISGATLGLTLDYEQALRADDPGGPLLVPAWLFTVKNSTETIPWIAVDPAYLEQPSPEPAPADKPEPGAGTEPSQAPPPKPVPGTSGQPTETETLPIDAYTLEGDRVIHVQVTLGDCKAQWEPRLEAKQGADAVYLLLTASGSPPPPDGACTAIASEHDVTVTLDAALGDRKVYDAHDMRELSRRK